MLGPTPGRHRPSMLRADGSTRWLCEVGCTRDLRRRPCRGVGERGRPRLARVAEALREEVEAGFGQHPDAEIYLSQPGLGPILNAWMLAEFGEDPTRDADADGREKYFGMTPMGACIRFVRLSGAAREGRNHRSRWGSARSVHPPFRPDADAVETGPRQVQPALLPEPVQHGLVQGAEDAGVGPLPHPPPAGPTRPVAHLGSNLVQPIPVDRTKAMPSSTSRSATRGRPVRPCTDGEHGGISGSTSTHSSSLISRDDGETPATTGPAPCAPAPWRPRARGPTPATSSYGITSPLLGPSVCPV